MSRGWAEAQAHRISPRFWVTHLAGHDFPQPAATQSGLADISGAFLLVFFD